MSLDDKGVPFLLLSVVVLQNPAALSLLSLSPQQSLNSRLLDFPHTLQGERPYLMAV
jgi:hypothetical protein